LIKSQNRFAGIKNIFPSRLVYDNAILFFACLSEQAACEGARDKTAIPARHPVLIRPI